MIQTCNQQKPSGLVGPAQSKPRETFKQCCATGNTSKKISHFLTRSTLRFISLLFPDRHERKTSREQVESLLNIQTSFQSASAAQCVDPFSWFLPPELLSRDRFRHSSL